MNSYNSGPTPPVDSSRRFLNLSGGMLALAITAVVAICCVGPVVLCLVSGVVGGITGAGNPSPTP